MNNVVDFPQGQKPANGAGSNGEGNKVRDYRLDQLEKRMSAIETKVDAINTTVTEIKTGMITKTHLLLTSLGLIGTLVAHLIIKSLKG